MDSRRAAKAFRQNMTEAEQRLWYHLRAHRLVEQKFRRQQPIGQHVVDFVHFGAKLIIEADGGQHLDSAHDEVRDLWLQNQGFRIMRFWNNDILQNTESVLTAIFDAVSHPLSPGPSPTGGEGSAIEGVSIRVGLNAGEPIEEDAPDGRRDLFGATVILASRICAMAGAGEILVPETVRGLLAGKGFVFGDRGEFVPKGFDEGVRVWEVRWRQ